MTAASTLSRESLWLRFGGMALTLLGLMAAAWIGDAADLQQIPTSDDRSALAPWAGGWLVAANAFAIGVILLLAGLRQVSLLTSRRARHGTLVKIAAANRLLACGAFTFFQESGVLDAVIMQWYFALRSSSHSC